ncbi:DUF4962 domain-containing protein [Paenibacillus aurantius]|uniref:DUF4962 domain-containing protein n=1 Tax=Paenibacillus aurantius TaxID=2918900 RepID=A0AA96LB08_9BACL|nr:DUF4962 domain-containing protein [Paenibacillus aurantius]WNQ09900.1 DUF4962 domain-containing protein [Paenibacillus aurantius]
MNNVVALYQPKTGKLTVAYSPDGKTRLLENPPRFTWMPARLEEERYGLQLSSSPEFGDGETETFGPLSCNFHTPDRALAPGRYYWRYALLKPGTDDPMDRDSEWGAVRSFEVPEGLPETPLPSRNTRYAHAVSGRPRLWLGDDRLAAFREKVKADPGGTGWDEFYEKSVLPWLEKPLIAEPSPYPNNRRVAALWRRMYMDCQEVLYAIRHMSVAGVVLEDGELLQQAKEWLLHAARWNPEGTTSRDYNDEAAFRIAGALAWGYDWLHDVLSEAERAEVRRSLFRRTEQVAFHVMERSKIHHVPYDSHAVRSLSSVLVPCCLALLEEEPEAREWLDYTIEYYSALYTPWGGEDGGWAEGPMYWTTGMAFVTEAMNLLRNYTGIDLYKRPFFRKTGDFPLYVFSPDTIRTSFCDMSNLGEPPSLKTGFNIRQFAGITGNPYYQWYYEQVKARDTEADGKFYNYGWWDFRFDEMMYRLDYPQVEAKPPSNLAPLKWFRDVGWVAMHSRMEDPSEHIMLLAKSSPYGSISHSHGDQNAFVLHAYGEPLAIESGYYGAFGSTLHTQWRRQTRSKNTLLIDGKGQYAGTDKRKNMEASGTILEAAYRGEYPYTRMDATPAYREEVPYLRRFEREIYFVRSSYFILVDHIDLDRPGRVDWLFHTLHPMKLGRQAFAVRGEKADMDVRFVYCSSGELQLSQSDTFEGVDPEELEGLGNHWHLKAVTREAAGHRIVTLLVPMKKSAPKYVSHFMDDQDHGVHLYFTEEGETHKVEVPKVYST